MTLSLMHPTNDNLSIKDIRLTSFLQFSYWWWAIKRRCPPYMADFDGVWEREKDELKML